MSHNHRRVLELLADHPDRLAAARETLTRSLDNALKDLDEAFREGDTDVTHAVEWAVNCATALDAIEEAL